MKSPVLSKRETGMALLISLLAMVLLSIGAVVLLRSVDNATVLAGNVSFKQATMSVGDLGVEKAIEYMKSPGGAISTHGLGEGWKETGGACDWTTAKDCQYYPKALSSDFSSAARPQTTPSPSMCDPITNKGKPLGVPMCAMWLGSGTQAIDWDNIRSYSKTDDTRIPDGYNVRFVIDRLCNPLSSEDSAWNPATTPTDFTQPPPTNLAMVEKYCRLATKSAQKMGSNAADHFRFTVSGKPVLYRITVQVNGPRNTQAFLQTYMGQ